MPQIEFHHRWRADYRCPFCGRLSTVDILYELIDGLEKKSIAMIAVDIHCQ